jgi:hypothetical protein
MFYTLNRPQFSSRSRQRRPNVSLMRKPKHPAVKCGDVLPLIAIRVQGDRCERCVHECSEPGASGTFGIALHLD